MIGVNDQCLFSLCISLALFNPWMFFKRLLGNRARAIGLFASLPPGLGPGPFIFSTSIPPTGGMKGACERGVGNCVQLPKRPCIIAGPTLLSFCNT